MPESIQSISQLEQRIREAQLWFIPDCSKSIALMQALIPQAQALGAAQQEAEAQLLMARSYWALNQLELGHEALNCVQKLDEKHKLPLQNATHDNLRADLFFAASDYSQALKFWTSSLKKALKLSAFDLYIESCLGLGNIFTAHAQYGEALRWHDLALEFARKSPDHELLAECYLHVAADYNFLGEYQLTLAISKQAETAFMTSRHKAWLADWYLYRGEAHFHLNAFNEALAWLHNAWQLNQQYGYAWSQSLNLLALGRTHTALNRFDDAEYYLNLAHEKISSFGAHSLLLRVYSLLAELGKAKSDFQMEWENRRLYNEMAIADAQQLAKEKLTTSLERRMRELDTQLLVLQTRQENVLLRQKSSADSELLQTLRMVSLQDPLTGVSNRRSLDEEMPVLFQRCNEDNRTLSVLMFDLDHFKQVNDRFGHPVGDEVIKVAAQLLLQSCRGGDIVARYGGEEFVLLLPGAVGRVALEVSERIRQRVQNYTWQAIHPELSVTCSIGVAEKTFESSANELLNHADQALYEAKHLGRNRVELFI